MVMQERMEILVQNNLEKAQKNQEWYDRHACQRKFETGDQVLVLLPTNTSKVTARWQGPFEGYGKDELTFMTGESIIECFM